MKTKNLILIAAMVFQLGIVLGSVAQKSVNVYPGVHALKIKKLTGLTPEFSNVNHSKFGKMNKKTSLQGWMLSPDEWINNPTNNEARDTQINLESWMLDPSAMLNTGSNALEQSVDSPIMLEDWMLDPNEMATARTDEKVKLEPWMLNPTKW